MFTGIIEEIGSVLSLSTAELLLWDGTRGEGHVLVIACSACLDGAYLGCSIAVNGVCLTVTAFTATSFTVNCAPETMRRTNLLSLAPGAPVNLERAARADARNSGHYVQGHVDCTGAIAATWREGDSLWVRVAAPLAALRFIVEKGFIAVDGTSLTGCAGARGGGGEGGGGAEGEAAWGGSFTLMLIAHTQRHVTLPGKAVGARVNLEVDVAGKLVERSTAGLMEAVEKLGAKLEGAVARLEGRLGVLEARVGALEEGKKV